MGPFAAGEVVLLPFPFTDLSGTKLRPALLLVHVRQVDWIVCQITSNPHADPRAIPLASPDFIQGGLQRLSYICPGKLFTASESIFVKSAGFVDALILKRVRDSAIEIIQSASRP
jgi:mRNA interferase MazF